MKKSSVIFYCLLIVILSRYGVLAQDKDTRWFVNRIEPLAKEYYRIGDYKKALEGYLSLDSASPGNTEYNYRIGICYLHSSYKSRAYPYLEYVYKQADSPENIFFEMGRAYHFGHEFRKAIIFYESYKKDLLYRQGAARDGEAVREVDRYIQMCRNGLRLVRDPMINVQVTNLGPNVNGPFSDFSPLINKNEDMLIFSSKRKATNRTKSDPLTGQFYENVFCSVRDDGTWSKAGPIGNTINHDDIHDAAVGLAPDGKKLFLYRGDKNVFGAKISGDIFISEYADNQWAVPVSLEVINSGSWESHASITEAGDMIVFTSDREGGVGRTDIYFSTLDPAGNWSAPENMGEYINTIFDEDGPFIHPDGNKLYFSSKGHDSMGGYDIFYTEYLVDKDRWTRPKNMGYPINTADDDLFFVWSADGERAWFSSEREDSYGEADIYLLTRNDLNVVTTEISGKIYDGITGNPAASEIIIRDMLSNQLIGIYDADENEKNYRVNLRTGRRYLLTIRATGYNDLVTELDLSEINDPVGEKNFRLRKEE
jgi:hypothetical protein